MISIDSRNLDQDLYHFESVLNIAGYIIGLSSATGALRMVYGKLEIIGAVALAMIKLIEYSWSETEETKQEILSCGSYALEPPDD